MFLNCPRDGHLAEETNKSLCLSTSDTTLSKDWRRNMLAHTALKPCTEHMCFWIVLQASSQWIHTNIRLMFGHYGGYHSPPYVFCNAPNKLPNQNIHRDIKLKFVMLAYHVLPKKLPNSGRFPHWRQLWCEWAKKKDITFIFRSYNIIKVILTWFCSNWEALKRNLLGGHLIWRNHL